MSKINKNSLECDCKVTYEGRKYITSKVWTETFSDKHGVLAGDIGKIIKCYERECKGCGNKILVTKVKVI